MHTSPCTAQHQALELQREVEAVAAAQELWKAGEREKSQLLQLLARQRMQEV